MPSRDSSCAWSFGQYHSHLHHRWAQGVPRQISIACHGFLDPGSTLRMDVRQRGEVRTTPAPRAAELLGNFYFNVQLGALSLPTGWDS